MKNLFGFIIILLVIVAIYNAFVSGGGIHLKNFFVVPGISTSGIHQSSTSTNYYGGGSASSQGVNSQSVTAVTPPSGFTANQLSPFYGQVRITKGWFSGGVEIDLSVSYSSLDQKKINVTGWRVQGNRNSFIISQAIANYIPYGIEQAQDISLTNGDYVRMYSNMSPISQNLRLNKCTGYLDAYDTGNNGVGYNFSPSLPNDCPALDQSQIATFSDRCQSFIQQTGVYGCKIPATGGINAFGGYGDEACQAFLNKINYGGCYEKHFGEADFFSREWWLWMGGIATVPQFSSDHDNLLLFDGKGLLVDEYSY